MYETLASEPARRPMAGWSTSYAGPERRAAHGALGSCLMRMLDEVDYGMLLVAADAQVVFLNHAARLELDGTHPLQLMGNNLRAHRPQDVAPLFDALAGAQRGLRRLLTLGEGESRISVSVVPIPQPPGGASHADDAAPVAMLIVGKRRVCERLSIEWFARCMHLTPAETRVLEQLCAGVSPNAIAELQNVAVCTVRTQIGSIRAKTGADSIAALLRLLARLPPLVGALRGGAVLAAR